MEIPKNAKKAELLDLLKQAIFQNGVLEARITLLEEEIEVLQDVDNLKK